ncbi:MAG: flagellar assembly protein FliH [Arcobacter sp.]|nr:flagellar assembly protein FliH [Arcobacter sp.]
MQKLAGHLAQIETKITNIENNGMSGRDLDKQLVQALKDLKNYATFFEQATFQLETKILKTSMSIAKKIIGVEIGEQSANIAKITITNILNKIKTASKITIHLNPKDYIVLKNDLNLDSFIQIQEDSNVTAGGVVIASDLGNFDGNIEAKVQTILESLDTLM